MARSEWSRVPLGRFVTLQRGHDLPDERRRPGTVPILGSFGITGWHDEPKAPGPGVAIGRSGASFGVVSYSPVAYWPLNTALYVIDFHGNDERFAYYLLRCFDFRSYNSGSAQPSLNRNFIHPALVDVPPLREQVAIANFLGTLDDKIEQNRRMNETLEATAGAIFKSWFVDFDPVRVKAEGGDTGLPNELAELFPDSFEESELEEVPKGWPVGTIGNVATLNRETVTPADAPDEFFDHFSIPAYDNGRSPKREQGATIQSNKFLVSNDSVLLSKLNPRIPRVWLPQVGADHRAVSSTEFLVLRPRPPVDRAYLYCLLSSVDFAREFETLVTGTSGSHQRVKPENLLQMRHVVVPEAIIARFAEYVRPLLARISTAAAESVTLAAIRDTLLPKLISGELRVRDAERSVAISA